MAKWCPIHHTPYHDYTECTTNLEYMQKGEKPTAGAEQEALRKDGRRGEDEEEEEGYPKINMLIAGSRTIPSKTQYRKMEQEVLLATPLQSNDHLAWSG